MARSAFRNLFSPAALACFLLTAAIGFGLDQWSKAAAVSNLAVGNMTAGTGALVGDTNRARSLLLVGGGPAGAVLGFLLARTAPKCGCLKSTKTSSAISTATRLGLGCR